MEFLEAVLAKMNAKTKSNQAKAAKMKATREQMLARMEAKIDANQADMRSTLCAFQSELKETIQHEMRSRMR
jgi:gamma-glutamylcysteine synthetase